MDTIVKGKAATIAVCWSLPLLCQNLEPMRVVPSA